MKVWLFVLAAFVLVILGCGGGGGAVPSYTVTGTVIWLPTNDIPNPAAATQIGSAARATSLVDGSFVQPAPAASASMLVSYVPPAESPVAFTFRFPAVTGNTDLGQLVLGPEKITVSGRVLAADTGSPVNGVQVFFGGQYAVSNSLGVFTIIDVGYSSSALANFFTITGRTSATGYLPVTFGASTAAAAGIVDVGDLQLPPTSTDTPPGIPGNLFGTVSPAGSAPGSVVRVFNSGGTPIRQFTVGSDRKYGFWLSAGTYTIRATNGSLTSGDISVTIASADVPVTRDLSMN